MVLWALGAIPIYEIALVISLLIVVGCEEWGWRSIHRLITASPNDGWGGRASAFAPDVRNAP